MCIFLYGGFILHFVAFFCIFLLQILVFSSFTVFLACFAFVCCFFCSFFLVAFASHFFPACQVRVVRFYQSCSPPPPRLAVLLLLLVLLQFLLDHVCISFHLHFRLANSSPSQLSSPSSLRQALCQLPSSVCAAGPQPGTFPAQCAPLDLNLGPAQLSLHRWTSTWDLPSSVCTAGPQPGTSGAQLSVHRWTSTWDLPSSVCTAGPQPGTFPAQCAPLDLNLGPAQLSVHRWTPTAR